MSAAAFRMRQRDKGQDGEAEEAAGKDRSAKRALAREGAAHVQCDGEQTSEVNTVATVLTWASRLEPEALLGMPPTAGQQRTRRPGARDSDCAIRGQQLRHEVKNRRQPDEAEPDHQQVVGKPPCDDGLRTPRTGHTVNSNPALEKIQGNQNNGGQDEPLRDEYGALTPLVNVSAPETPSNR